jgi:hypothetical protein
MLFGFLGIIHRDSSRPLNMLRASLRGAPSWPNRPFAQTRPASTRLCSHKWRYHLPARLYLQRLPTRRDSDVESERRKACQGRGSVYIVLPRHVSLHLIPKNGRKLIQVPYLHRTVPDTTNYHCVHSVALGAAGVLGCQTFGRRSQIAHSK